MRSKRQQLLASEAVTASWHLVVNGVRFAVEHFEECLRVRRLVEWIGHGNRHDDLGRFRGRNKQYSSSAALDASRGGGPVVQQLFPFCTGDTLYLTLAKWAAQEAESLAGLLGVLRQQGADYEVVYCGWLG